MVARDGFDGVTFRSVAAEAGVTYGLASYYFRTREEMIQQALSWAVKHSIEAARLSPASGELSDFAGEVPALLSESPHESVFQVELLLRSLRDPALREEVRASYDDYIAATAQALQDFDIDDPALARLVFAALDGLTLQQLLYEDEARTRDAIAALRRLLALIAGSRHRPEPD